NKVRIQDDGTATAVYSVAPGARLIMPYLSLLMRMGVSMYEFEEFVETHPSTDGVYKLMRFLSRY
ncbi:MAG: NAD(P)/FAD-dependent oxidoreductase, partial [Methanothermobacter sp.]